MLSNHGDNMCIKYKEKWEIKYPQGLMSCSRMKIGYKKMTGGNGPLMVCKHQWMVFTRHLAALPQL